MRGFVAVDLDAEARHALVASMAEISIPGKVVPPENWHLTLRFLGTVDEVTVDRVVAGLDQADLGPPFSIMFGALGAFPGPKRATVLWRAVADPDERLAELASGSEEACRAAGLEPEDRPFRAHLTLSRLRPDQDVRALVEAEAPESVTMHVSEVCLFRSHLGGPHARYEVVERFPLG